VERTQNIPKELISSALNIDYKMPISKAISNLKKYPAVIVYKDKEYFGIVDSRAIYRAKKGLKLSSSERVEKFTTKVPKISNSTSIYDLIYYFYKSGVKALPYSTGNKITGVLERKTLLKVLLSLNIMKDMQVNQAMTTPVLAIDSKASLAQAAATMREKNVNRLVVLEDSRFAGLLTNYDVAKKYTMMTSDHLPEMKTEVYKPANVAIKSIMERNAKSVEYNRPIAEAVRDMVENNISSLIVLKGGKPIGIMTVTDVFESILARQKTEPSKIFMSGFDDKTYQYEDEARESLKSFADSIERLSGIEVDYITLKVKSIRSKIYEMQVRVSLGKHGIISMNTTEYLFGDALNDIMTKLKNRIIKEKDSIVTNKRENLREE
jgi:CBS domain-containing protein